MTTNRQLTFPRRPKDIGSIYFGICSVCQFIQINVWIVCMQASVGTIRRIGTRPSRVHQFATMSAYAQAANIVCKNHFFEQVELAQLLYKQQRHSYGVVHSSILQRLLPYHFSISLSLTGENGQSRVCMNIRSCESQYQ